MEKKVYNCTLREIIGAEFFARHGMTLYDCMDVQDAPELREFVEAELSEDATECGDSRVVLQHDSVGAVPLQLRYERLHHLEDNLLLFFTGFARNAGDILRDQDVRTATDDQTMLAHLHQVKELGLRSRLALEEGDLDDFGALMHEHWEHKKTRSDGMSNARVDEWYELARQHGALGGKLVGAGGGGFLLFYTTRHATLREAMQRAGLQELRFRFDFEGTKVLS